MTTDAVGGVWQYSLALARGLVERADCDVMLVCFGLPREEELRDALPGGGVELHPLPLRLEWMPDSEADVREALEIVDRLATLWRADLVHSNQFCFGLLDSSIPKLVAAHSDVLGWLAWQRGQPPGSLSGVELDEGIDRYRSLVAAGLEGANAVVCPSHFMAGSLAATYGCRSLVIHNGLWPELYGPLDKENVAMVAGRLWDEAKGAATAIRAMDGLPLELWLAGPSTGPSGERVLLPAAPNVRQLGALNWRDTRSALARSIFYLAASTYEPFGLAALEAALSGCVLLASDIPSYREIWGDAALYCPCGNPASLRATLATLLETPTRIATLAQAARARALERYTADRMADRYRDLYRALVMGDKLSD